MLQICHESVFHHKDSICGPGFPLDIFNIWRGTFHFWHSTVQIRLRHNTCLCVCVCVKREKMQTYGGERFWFVEWLLCLKSSFRTTMKLLEGLERSTDSFFLYGNTYKEIMGMLWNNIMKLQPCYDHKGKERGKDLGGLVDIGTLKSCNINIHIKYKQWCPYLNGSLLLSGHLLHNEEDGRWWGPFEKIRWVNLSFIIIIYCIYFVGKIKLRELHLRNVLIQTN